MFGTIYHCIFFLYSKAYSETKQLIHFESTTMQLTLFISGVFCLFCLCLCLCLCFFCLCKLRVLRISFFLFFLLNVDSYIQVVFPGENNGLHFSSAEAEASRITSSVSEKSVTHPPSIGYSTWKRKSVFESFLYRPFGE